MNKSALIVNWDETDILHLAPRAPKIRKPHANWKQCCNRCRPDYCEKCDGLGWTVADEDLYGDPFKRKN